MSTDYRAIMLAFLHEQTYATNSARLRCSSKTIRQVCSVMDIRVFGLGDVASLSDKQVDALFPDKRRDRDESQAPIDIPAFAVNPNLITHKLSPRTAPSTGTTPHPHCPNSGFTLSKRRNDAVQTLRRTLVFGITRGNDAGCQRTPVGPAPRSSHHGSSVRSSSSLFSCGRRAR